MSPLSSGIQLVQTPNLPSIDVLISIRHLYDSQIPALVLPAEIKPSYFQRHTVFTHDNSLAQNSSGQRRLPFRCHEPNLLGLVTQARTSEDHVWLDDSVEIFLSPDRDPKACHQLALNSNAVTYGCRVNTFQGQHAQCRTQAGREPNAWTLEVALPWDDIGATPQPGTEIAMQLVRNRFQHPAESTQWSPTFGNNYRVPFYGTMILQ